MRKSKIPTIIAIFTLVIGVAVGVFAVNQTQSFRLGASPETTPQDVQVSNIQDKTATITWRTDKAVVGSILWDETASVSKTASDGTSLKTLHQVTLTGLSAGKRYYFKITSSGSTYSNSGSPWTFDTTTKTVSKTQVLTGSVLNATGQPAANVQVFVSSQDVPLLSGTTTENGNWTVTAPIASDAILKETVDIFVQGGADGIASAQITFKDAQNTPAITLGKTHDFRGTAAVNSSNQPESLLSLPVTQPTNKQSGFAVEDPKPGTKTTTVDLKSIKDNEQIFTKKPEFFGDGTPGTTITITVHSTATATQTIKIPSSGSWRWSPSTQLEEGSHTVTITWKDATGILRTLTRNFVVNAATSGPAFESTPSGATATPIATKTPVPTKTPKPTVEPTETPIATDTPTPVATKSPRPTATASALPNAGVAENTYILLGLGLMMIMASFFIFKKA